MYEQGKKNQSELWDVSHVSTWHAMKEQSELNMFGSTERADRYFYSSTKEWQGECRMTYPIGELHGEQALRSVCRLSQRSTKYTEFIVNTSQGAS